MWLRYFVFFFFFKQKTAYEMRISDWSSDVCSSDLRPPDRHALPADDLDRRRSGAGPRPHRRGAAAGLQARPGQAPGAGRRWQRHGGNPGRTWAGHRTGRPAVTAPDPPDHVRSVPRGAVLGLVRPDLGGVLPGDRKSTRLN